MHGIATSGSLRGPRARKRVQADAGDASECARRPSAAERARALVARTSHVALSSAIGTSAHVTLAMLHIASDGQVSVSVPAEDAIADAGLEDGTSVSVLVVPDGLLSAGAASARATLNGCVDGTAKTEHMNNGSAVLVFAMDVHSAMYCGAEDAFNVVSVAGSEFVHASPDPLCLRADAIVRDFNESMPADDITRLGRHAGLSTAPLTPAASAYAAAADSSSAASSADTSASPSSSNGASAAAADVGNVSMPHLVWVDRLGVDVGCGGEVARLVFHHEVESESEARSAITMLAQTLWEQESKYNPPSPLKLDEEYVA